MPGGEQDHLPRPPQRRDVHRPGVDPDRNVGVPEPHHQILERPAFVHGQRHPQVTADGRQVKEISSANRDRSVADKSMGGAAAIGREPRPHTRRPAAANRCDCP